MAIKECLENGVVTYTVSVSMRSRRKPGARAQKLKKGIKSLRLAQAVEKEMLKEVGLDLARLESQTLKWRELMEKFELTMRTGSATQRAMQANVLREMVSFLNRFTSDWANRDCREIYPGDVRAVINSMEKSGYSQVRMRQFKTAINTVFRFGIEDGHLNGIPSSPAESVKVARYIDDKPPQILTIKEIHRLLNRAKEDQHPWYPIWFTALNTGMRSGELYALLWTDIDWDNKLITVSKSWNGRLKAIKSTKAGYWRKVPMNAELEALLKELRVKTPIHQQEVLPRATRWANGEQAKYLRHYCNEIGIANVNFHALRACFATHLLNAGVSSPIVKKICGWTEEKVMTRYIRLAGLDVSGATDSLSFSDPNANVGAKKVVNLRDALTENPLNPKNGKE